MDEEVDWTLKDDYAVLHQSSQTDREMAWMAKTVHVLQHVGFVT